MTETKFALTAIGNALVDVLTCVDEAFLERECAESGMIRNGMTLIDADRAVSLYEKLGQCTEMSGGSAGNTMACFTGLGGKGAYIGKVADDELGRIFTHDMRGMGAHFDTRAEENGQPTGRCIVLIDDQGERTMNTFLGAANALSPDDIDPHVIENSTVVYMEGYLFDPPDAKKAFYRAGELAHGAGRKVALTLSDSFCVHRHKADFLDLARGHVDLLFTNQAEIAAFMDEEESNWEQAGRKAAELCETVVVTLGAAGSAVFEGGEMTRIEAKPVDQVRDVTGAGDAYAAGYLFGYTNGEKPAACGRIASIAAAEVIAQIGPRPLRKLSELI